MEGLSELAKRENQISITDMTKQVRFVRSKRIGVPQMIIIHHSWTYDVEAMIRTLTRKGYGTHYAIDRDGRIFQVTKDEYVVSHCKTKNHLSLGIDLIRGDGQEILDCQYNALNDLLRHLVGKWNLPKPVLHKQSIFYHRDFRRTACPGRISDSKIYCV